MKNALFALVIVISFLAAAGCDTGIGPAEPTGFIQVSLPAMLQTQTIDMVFAQANVDTYTIIAYNATHTVLLEVPATPSGMGTAYGMITVPVGTYSVLVLGGDTLNAMASSPLALLGSGMVDSVWVHADQITAVIVTLDNLDFNITSPTTVAVGGDITVGLTYSITNPLIVLPAEPEVRLDDGVSHFFTMTQGPGIGRWSGSATFTAPVVAGTDAISFFSVNIGIVDSSHGVSFTPGDFGRDWTFPTALSDNPSIQAETIFPIIITAAQTGGVGVTIVWGPS